MVSVPTPLLSKTRHSELLILLYILRQLLFIKKYQFCSGCRQKNREDHISVYKVIEAQDF